MSENQTINGVTKTNLEEFKKLVRKAIFLEKNQENIFKKIPDSVWRGIFVKNFDGNFEYARRVLLKQFKDIDRIDTTNVNKEKKKIHNLGKATNMILDAYKKDQKIVYITDFDNDGSLAQSCINTYLEMDTEAKKNSILEYAQSISGSSRGINLAHLDVLAKVKGISQDEEFLIITADNGINSREEVKEIEQAYPNAKIIITDHHNPDEAMVVEENKNVVIFNPHYKPTAFYDNYNISGATTVGVLLQNVAEQRLLPIELEASKNLIEKMNTLFKVSNMLDYVETHAADKPEKDYVVTKFLQLQPLLNINNSISKIIVGEMDLKTIEALQTKIPNLNVDLLLEEAKNVHNQNHVARVLLHIYKAYGDKAIKDKYNARDFQKIYLEEISNQERFLDDEGANPNYIEQLRPLIFSFAADYDKSEFFDALANQMEQVFTNIRVSEQNMVKELRAGEVVTKQKLEHSTIAYADPNILTVFNRKFLNKVYNDENPGFSLTLDSIKPSRVSGSFRSIFDIDKIMPGKEKLSLEKKLNIRIETPGHKKAAGFIIISRDEVKNPITEKTIEEINNLVNKNIGKIKEELKDSSNEYIVTDFNSIGLIDDINKTIRGNISNFASINPLLKLTKDTVWTDSYTTEQYTLEDVAEHKKYGYITINMDFHGKTVIIPVELVRKIVESNYEDYLSLGYMDGGIFMVDKVVKNEIVNNIVDIRQDNEKEKLIDEEFTKYFSKGNKIELTREQIKDNPFFKYHDYGQLNFDLFERMVIGIIDSNKVDKLAVFDVEANGFANSKIMNFGSTNYEIDKNSGERINIEYFNKRFYKTSRGEEYLLEERDINNLKKLNEQEVEELDISLKKLLLIKSVGDKDSVEYEYYIPKNADELIKMKKLPFVQIRNYDKITREDGVEEVIYNREIKCEMLAYLIKDKDFKVPQEMIGLTGITQNLLNKHGKMTSEVDKELEEYYEGTKVLFGAHNTPYDARVLRANMPKMYELLKTNKIYDSALFSKEQKLAYDDVKVGNFEEVNGMPSNIYFYNNEFSDFSLSNFLNSKANGYYPDRSGQYLLECDNGSYYLVDKKHHEKIKINAGLDGLQKGLKTGGLPNMAVKYSVEKLSEQWMIHSLLLCNEKFNIKYVDVSNYPKLTKYKEALRFFQENYHFDISEIKNISYFKQHLPELAYDYDAGDELRVFLKDFLIMNKDIQQKFSDAWMYKKVLEIKDPTRIEITNDLIDLVHYQTNIPKDKIKVIFEDAIVFKEKYKINSIIHHESHVNGPWSSDHKGDVMFEDKLTLGGLPQREYNSYDHDIKPAIDYFNNQKIRAKLAFDMADQLSDDLAQDSYSFRQGILYNRDELSNVVNTIQFKEAELELNNRQLIKFKLENDILPKDTAVYALSKEGVTLSREQIEDHKHKLSFIMLYLQAESSLESKTMNVLEKPALKKIIEANVDKAIEYKRELQDIYDYVEYNRKDDKMKKLIDQCKKLLSDDSALRITNIDGIDTQGLNIVESVLDNLITELKTTRKFTEEEYLRVKLVKNSITEVKLNHELNSLEKALEGDSTYLGFGLNEDGTLVEEIKEKNFLNEVDIRRQNLGKKLMTDNLNQRFMNAIIDHNRDLTIKAYAINGKKRKM